jgi:prephenate dehydrogenase
VIIKFSLLLSKQYLFFSMLSLPFQRIAMVGLGLIGGSLVKSFRRTAPACQLIGVDYHEALLQARDQLDEVFLPHDLANALRQADLVFLATPISTILQLLPEVARTVPPGAVVTDVGSAKSRIVETARQHFIGERYFIGGHPMAGREKGGWENADPFLFEHTAYALTPPPDFPPDRLDALKNLLHAFGAHVVLIDPKEHDRVVADISHLPQLLAIALTNFIAREGTPVEPRLQMAAGGFRDMTRIAASPFQIWQDILACNRDNIRCSLQEFIAGLQDMLCAVDDEKMAGHFQNANQLRRLIERDT